MVLAPDWMPSGKDQEGQGRGMVSVCMETKARKMQSDKVSIQQRKMI